jgi:hypothetical protein
MPAFLSSSFKSNPAFLSQWRRGAATFLPLAPRGSAPPASRRLERYASGGILKDYFGAYSWAIC